MKLRKIFVLTDNKIMFYELEKILNCKSILKVDFFCSLKSSDNFQKEIFNHKIKPIIIRNNLDFFIKNYELGISAHSKQIFPAKLVNSILCINVHPGFNPYNRGWFPHIFSIINKLPAGATIHVMDEEIDHGDIIIQEKVKIHSYETSLDVYNKILAKEVELFKEVIDSILNNNFKRIKSKFEGNYNSINDFNKLREVDLNKKITLREAIDYLRAMTHPPYKNSYFFNKDGKKIYIDIELKNCKNISVDLTKLRKITLNEKVTMEEAIQLLTFKHNYFKDEDGNIILVSVNFYS